MKSPRLVRVLSLAMMFLFVAGVFLYAQEEAAKGDQVIKGRTFWELLKAGGTVGWFIVACSIASLALSIQYFVEIRREKLCPPELIGELEALCDEEQYEEAVALCEQEKTFMTNMLGAALAKVAGGYDDMKNAMNDIGSEEAFKLSVKISWLNMVGQVGPLLGLFGTVTGMISAFQIIEQKKTPSPADLARGIYEALVTTCQGLVVGIPVLAIYFYFKNKVGTLVIEMGLIGSEFLERFKSKG